MKLQIFVILASLAAFGTGQAATTTHPYSTARGVGLQSHLQLHNRKSDKCDVVGDITSNASKCGLKVPENSSFIRPSERSEGASGGTIPGQ